MLATQRLTLIPLTPTHLRWYLTQPAQLEAELGVPVSRAVVTASVHRAIEMKLAKMARADPPSHAWYTYWLIVLAEIPFGAGLAGFKGAPDEHGQVEIGYGIDPAWAGHGYTTEAVRALLEWAFQDSTCLAVVALHTRKQNLGSLRVLAKVGMTIYAEATDTYDLRVTRADWERAR